MANRAPARVVLDTNILISASVYGGKPREVLFSVLKSEIEAVISSILLAELLDVLGKKFAISEEDIQLLEQEILDKFILVQPREPVEVLKDDDDNRVLEAALTGNCNFIITGDKELLKLKSFRGIRILTASEFLDLN